MSKKYFQISTQNQITRWFSNPLTKGSYSYINMATDVAGRSPLDMAEPEYDGALLFAGEATSDRLE